MRAFVCVHQELIARLSGCGLTIQILPSLSCSKLAGLQTEQKGYSINVPITSANPPFLESEGTETLFFGVQLLCQGDAVTLVSQV